MKFAIVNLGCKVNQVESDTYGSLLLSQGLEFTQASDADIVVVNTCTVTGVAEKKTRKAVRQALKQYPRARVLVTGCAAAINPDFFTSLDERIFVAPKPDVESTLRICCQAPYSHDENLVPGTKFREDQEHQGLFTSRARVGVKVQDGCDNACAYCIVHVARGRARSRALPEIVADVVRLAKAGVREIVLSGINIGSYEYEGIRLAGLLETLLSETADLHEPNQRPVRFRVSSVEPMDISDDFISLMAHSNGRICKHLHLPLQSGSSKVLREMARPYDAEDFRGLIDAIRVEVPDISLSTDIIVGFPGETEDDFGDTLALARYCGFSKIHVFPYSKREGTPAAIRIDQVDPVVKLERARILRELSDDLRAVDYANRAGICEFVLVEQPGFAMTESYYEIPVSRELAVGSLCEVELPEQLGA